jgi:hypothetical protein
MIGSWSAVEGLRPGLPVIFRNEDAPTVSGHDKGGRLWIRVEITTQRNRFATLFGGGDRFGGLGRREGRGGEKEPDQESGAHGLRGEFPAF